MHIANHWGRAITKLILETLQHLYRFNLLMENCQGQTYDGARNITYMFLVKCMEHSMVRNMTNICDRVALFYKYSPKCQCNLEESIAVVIQ